MAAAASLGLRVFTGRAVVVVLTGSRRAPQIVLRHEMRSHGHEPRAAAIVVASLVDPARVQGAHPRAHAEEGRLYREAVEAALAACKLSPATIPEKTLRAVAGKRLGRGAPPIDATLKALSHVVGTPWRAPEKQATLAAWISLGP